MGGRQGADRGVMHEIVGPVAVPRQRPREGAQMGHAVDQGRMKLRRCFLDSRLSPFRYLAFHYCYRRACGPARILQSRCTLSRVVRAARFIIEQMVTDACLRR